MLQNIVRLHNHLSSDNSREWWDSSHTRIKTFQSKGYPGFYIQSFLLSYSECWHLENVWIPFDPYRISVDIDWCWAGKKSSIFDICITRHKYPKSHSLAQCGSLSQLKAFTTRQVFSFRGQTFLGDLLCSKVDWLSFELTFPVIRREHFIAWICKEE